MTSAVFISPAQPTDEVTKLRALQQQFGVPDIAAGLTQPPLAARPAVAPAPASASAPAPATAAPASRVAMPSTAPVAAANPYLADEKAAQEETGRLRSTGSGVSQIKNPWLRAVARIGDVAGTAMFPGVAAAIPGTTLHHDLLIGQQQNRIVNDQKQAQADANVGKTQAETDEAQRLANAPPPAPSPEEQFIADYRQRNPNASMGDVLRAYTESTSRPTPVSVQHVTVAGPDGKPMLANYDPRTGSYTDASGKPIANPTPYEAPRPVSEEEKFIAEYKQGHPGASEADAIKAYSDLTARPSFPRIEPVNDSQGNILGYNYLEGTTGGGVAMHFVPAGAGGAPTVNGAIPPKPTAGTLGMEQMARMTQTQIAPLQQEVAQVAKKLGPAVGRWNDYMVGKIGTDDPEFAGLKEDLKLFASAVVRTHFGARGGERYIEALENDFRAAQSPADLQARIEHAGGWIQGYANGAGLSPGTAGQHGTEGGGSGGYKAGDTRTYKGATYVFKGGDPTVQANWEVKH